MLALIANVTFKWNSDAQTKVAGELKLFGIEFDDVSKRTHLSRVIAIVEEIESIKIRIAQIVADTNTPRAVRTFFCRYDERSGARELSYARIIRHLASALLIEESMKRDGTVDFNQINAFERIVEDE